MTATHPRLIRERRTIEAMLKVYCRNQHNSAEGSLCPECSQLRDYAMMRLDRCPFQENKPTCAKCTVHCYRPAEREQIRVVMRYAGPRMLLRHPLLATMHLADGMRKPPQLSRRKPVSDGSPK